MRTNPWQSVALNEPGGGGGTVPPVDAADAAMETNKGISVAIGATSAINEAAELALLPN